MEVSRFARISFPVPKSLICIWRHSVLFIDQILSSRNYFFHNWIKFAGLAKLGLYSFQNPSPSGWSISQGWPSPRKSLTTRGLVQEDGALPSLACPQVPRAGLGRSGQGDGVCLRCSLLSPSSPSALSALPHPTPVHYKSTRAFHGHPRQA